MHMYIYIYICIHTYTCNVYKNVQGPPVRGPLAVGIYILVYAFCYIRITKHISAALSREPLKIPMILV